MKRIRHDIITRLLLRFIAIFILGISSACAIEPILPLPKTIDYDPVKAELGKRLFFEPRLSLNNKVSCASCHNVYTGGADNRAFSAGVNQQMGDVNTPTVLNSYFNFRQFWDGRARNLIEQAEGPLHNPKEMALDEDAVKERLNSDPAYLFQFQNIYHEDKVGYPDVIDAIVEFEKALITPNSKFDQYLRKEAKLTEKELNGYKSFKRLGCITCHNGINVGGNSYQYMGAVIPFDKISNKGDIYNRTLNPFDKHRYKVPSLRNIELTAPYLHDGSIKDLELMVKTMAYHNIGIDLTAEEVNFLVAFLKTLTGEIPSILQ